MSLISCPECGNQVSDKAKQCPNCGCPIANECLLLCPECGNKVNSNFIQCPHCGFPLAKNTSKQMADSVLTSSGTIIDGKKTLQRSVETSSRAYSARKAKYDEETLTDEDRKTLRIIGYIALTILLAIVIIYILNNF